MKKKYILWLLVVFVFSSLGNAQEIDLVFLKLHKGLEQDKNPEMGIGLLLKDTMQIVSLSNKSKITLLTDNEDNNLLVALPHQKQLINFEQSQLIDEGLGILIEVAAIPGKMTKNIHLRGQLTYNIIDNESEKSIILKAVDFNNWSTILVEEKSIPLRKDRYSDSVKGSMISFRFRNNNALYNIRDICMIESGDDTAGRVEFKRFTNDAILAISEALIDNKYDLKIIYNRVKTKSILLNKKFGLGL